MSSDLEAKFGDEAVRALGDLVPSLVRRSAVCPACEDTKSTMSILWSIIHLNDRHEWTREAIADWLDTIDVDLTVKACT